MAAEAHTAEHAGPTAGEYISHHLTHLRSQEQNSIIDFHVLNWDSLFWSILMGVVGLFFLWRVARSVTSGVPGRAQGAVEFLLEMVDNQAKSIVHNATSRKFVGPLALTVFIWILLMNAMDFLPVDLLPLLWEKIVGAAGGDPHHAYMRSVPTADLSSLVSTKPSPTFAWFLRPICPPRWACLAAYCWFACFTTSRSRAWAAGCTNWWPHRSATTSCCGPSTSCSR